MEAVDVAVELTKTFREHRLSEKEIDAILQTLNRLHGAGKIDLRPRARTITESVVPSTSRTLKERAEVVLPSKDDIAHTEYIIDTSALMQLQDRVVVSVGDVPQIIQAMMDDNRIPKQAWYVARAS